MYFNQPLAPHHSLPFLRTKTATQLGSDKEESWPARFGKSHVSQISMQLWMPAKSGVYVSPNYKNRKVVYTGQSSNKHVPQPNNDKYQPTLPAACAQLLAHIP